MSCLGTNVGGGGMLFLVVLIVVVGNKPLWASSSTIDDLAKPVACESIAYLENEVRQSIVSTKDYIARCSIPRANCKTSVSYEIWHTLAKPICTARDPVEVSNFLAADVVCGTNIAALHEHYRRFLIQLGELLGRRIVDVCHKGRKGI